MGDFVGTMGTDPLPAWAGFNDAQDRRRGWLREEDSRATTCPDDPKRAADDFRTFSAEDYQRQQRENGEEVVPFDNLEFTVEGRYFACAKNPPADLRLFFCTTNMGNAMVTTDQFRHSKGDEADIADMKAAMAELTPIVDDVPIGPGLSDI